MKHAFRVVFLISMSVSALTAVTAARQGHIPAQSIRRHERSIPGSYIVVLKPEVGPARVAQVAKNLAAAHAGRLASVYRHALRGFSVQMSEKSAEALSRHPQVEYVEEDGVVELAATQQNAPWGLDRIDQRALPLSTTYSYAETGVGVHAYVIDSGIRTTHEEFEGRAAVAFDNVGDGQNGEDCHGHGTKVAAVVGGKTFGVAKGVQLHAVRIFNCSNAGSSVAKLVEAIDWVTANHQTPAVAVLSVVTGGNASLDQAVRNSIAAGVTYAVAAGNTDIDAGTRSPARVAEALTVGATDAADTRAVFSNHGAALDLFAPGVDVPTASIFSDTATTLESGTSMATAHAAGVAARYLEVNSLATPAAVNQAIINDATTCIVLDPGPGSPNRLLHVAPPPPPPPPVIVASKVDSYAGSPSPAVPGQTITYTVMVNNLGPSDATSVTFTDTVDPHTTLVPGSVSPPTAAINGDTLTVTVGTLPANTSVNITFQVTIDNPFTGGSPQVSNQGTVTADGGIMVMTDDPDAFGPNQPTVTPVLITNIFARDGKGDEPQTGIAPLLFTITLSSPATSPVTVNYATADGGTAPATGGAACAANIDYVTASGTATFAVGEQVRTVSVDICSDGTAELNETLLLNLTGATGGTILDNQATGTITPAAPVGTTLISELRTFGPGAANNPNDDFVEIYNNSDSAVTVAASDASAGWGVYTAATCNSAPLLLGTIPNGTVIPPRGHYLLVGSAYSLANYGGTGAAAGNLTMTADLPTNASVGVFSTSDVTNLSTGTRLDAVGFGVNTGGAVCDLLREGATAPAVSNNLTMLGQYSILRDPCGKGGNTNTFGLCPTNGIPKDSNVNGSDFFMVEPNGTDAGSGARLGVAGPENLASARINMNFGTALLDATLSSAAAPNRVRDFTSDPSNNSTFGTLSIRRRYINNTGAPVTRLRFRVIDTSTFPAGSGVADMRARTAPSSISVTVNDPATCGAKVPTESAPCSVTVLGTTLEEPPAQPNGGGFNATLAAGTITTGTPLAPGASINVQFLLGVEQTGNFKFTFTIEALP